MTLRFLGDRPATDVAGLVAALGDAVAAGCPGARTAATARTAASRHPGERVRGGARATPRPGWRAHATQWLWLPSGNAVAARVLALSVDSEALAELAVAVGVALAGRGIPAEPRPWLAHVTVARLRRGALPPPLPPLVPGVHFDVAGVGLYRSVREPAGIRYEPLHVVPLPAHCQPGARESAGRDEQAGAS